MEICQLGKYALRVFFILAPHKNINLSPKRNFGGNGVDSLIDQKR